jgi:hypothetical protein
MLSLIPGSIFGALFDNIMPHLSFHGFLYIFAAGMVVYSLLSHLLSALFGYKENHNGFTI